MYCDMGYLTKLFGTVFGRHVKRESGCREVMKTHYGLDVIGSRGRVIGGSDVDAQLISSEMRVMIARNQHMSDITSDTD